MDTGAIRPNITFRSDNVLGAVYRLDQLDVTPCQLVDALLQGEMSTPDGKLQFRSNEGGAYAASYDPFKPGGAAQIRFDSLTVFGGSLDLAARHAALDWELKAAATPYNDLQELANELGLGPLIDKISFEVLAFNIAVIDGAKSTITGARAQLVARLAGGLDTNKVTFGYRAVIQGTVIERRMVSGDAMRWCDDGGVQQGTAEVEVQAASVLHCVLSYAGIAQSHYWIADPTTLANARRVVYEQADSNLEILTEFVLRVQARRQDARDLETGMAWLLWMQGFSVAHLGATARTQDAIDLVATTPNGHFAIIECTTGLLKAESKLARLVERTEGIRQRLIESGNRHLRVLPIIVTSLEPDSKLPHGVVILCQAPEQQEGQRDQHPCARRFDHRLEGNCSPHPGDHPWGPFG